MNITEYYKMERDGLEEMLKSTHLLPEFQVELERLIREALVQVKGTLLLAEETDEKHSLASTLTGKQRENESIEDFKTRVGNLGNITGEYLHLEKKLQTQREITTKASKALNDFTVHMAEQII